MNKRKKEFKPKPNKPILLLFKKEEKKEEEEEESTVLHGMVDDTSYRKVKFVNGLLRGTTLPLPLQGPSLQ